jgi:putative FmdB family regulatory protein
MPIYAYRCSSCGHAKDVLQKVSDPVLTTCPACGAETFAKQVTAAGFQLKGSGWYVTDFRGNGTADKTAADKKAADSKPATEGGAAATPADSSKPAADKSAPEKPAAAPATPPAASS